MEQRSKENERRHLSHAGYIHRAFSKATSHILFFRIFGWIIRHVTSKLYHVLTSMLLQYTKALDSVPPQELLLNNIRNSPWTVIHTGLATVNSCMLQRQRLCRGFVISRQSSQCCSDLVLHLPFLGTSVYLRVAMRFVSVHVLFSLREAITCVYVCLVLILYTLFGIQAIYYYNFIIISPIHYIIVCLVYSAALSDVIVRTLLILMYVNIMYISFYEIRTLSSLYH